MSKYSYKAVTILILLITVHPCKAQSSKWRKYVTRHPISVPQPGSVPGNNLKDAEETTTGARDLEDLAGSYGQHFVNDRFMNDMRHDAELRLTGSSDRGVLYSYRTYVFEGEGTFYESRSNYVGAGDDVPSAIKNRLYKFNLDATDEPDHYELDESNSYGVLFTRDLLGNVHEALVPAWLLGTVAKQQNDLMSSLTSQQRSAEERQQAIDEERRSANFQLNRTASNNRSTSSLRDDERSERYQEDRRDTENTERFDRMQNTARPISPDDEAYSGRIFHPLPTSVAPFARGAEEGRISAMTQAQTERSFAHLAGTNASADSLAGNGLIHVDPIVSAHRLSIGGPSRIGIVGGGRGMLNAKGSITGVGRGGP